ncbi:MAG TPA: transglycosylase domain-containing protein [Candidatus Paceibacterota bacterium]|nr:transglycosylase domain-containing protein [Candidatus Paceibacterota bacterium]
MGRNVPDGSGTNRPKRRRIVIWILGSFALAAGCVALGLEYGPSVVERVDRAYPELFQERLALVDISPLASKYFREESDVVAGGRKVACFSNPEHRKVIKLPSDIPPLFAHAILASEDKTFYEHNGVDAWAIGRAGGKSALGLSRSGASTLEMQIAKNVVGRMGRATLFDKMREAVMALRIDRMLTKQEIFLTYVNMPYFGFGQYGIEAASRYYFRKSAKDLDLAQVSLVVSLVNKPRVLERAYFGKDDPASQKAAMDDALLGARRVVRLMHEEGFISGAEYDDAMVRLSSAESLAFAPFGSGCASDDSGRYYTEHVRIETNKTLLANGLPTLNSGGYQLYLSRDEEIQELLNLAVEKTVTTYKDRHKNDPDVDQIRAAAYAIEFTGKVLGMVGNIDFAKLKFNVATDGWRQAGSTFKPFTYGGFVERLVEQVLAEEPGAVTLDEITASAMKRCTVLDQGPFGVRMGNGKIHHVDNFRPTKKEERQYYGQVSCYEAVGRSLNVAAMRAGQAASMDRIISLIYRLGMPKDEKHLIPAYPTTAIGAAEVNLFGMSSLIALVNGGYKIAPTFVNDVCDANGKSVVHFDSPDPLDPSVRIPHQCDPDGKTFVPGPRVTHPAVSAVMMQVLQGPLDPVIGTAKSLRNGIVPGVDIYDMHKLKPSELKARQLSFPVDTAGVIAGKTGTATNADGKTSDVWLLLFIPGPVGHPEKGVMLAFWMGKDSKDGLGGRDSFKSGRPETGGRNWTHSAAMILKFLQDERGLLKPEHRFVPVAEDDASRGLSKERPYYEIPQRFGDAYDEPTIIDPADPAVDPALVEELHRALEEEAQQAPTGESVPEDGTPEVDPTQVPSD